MNLAENNTDEYNRLKNQISNMNMEIKIFLEKFVAFRKLGIMDRTLFLGLQDIFKNIEAFLDSDPKDLKSDKVTRCCIDFEQHFLERILICNLCKEDVGDRWKDVQKHTSSTRHLSKYRNVHAHKNKKDVQNGNKNNNLNNQNSKVDVPKQISIPKEKSKEKKKQERVEKLNIPKRAKSFLGDDLGNFFGEASLLGQKLKQLPEYNVIEESLNKVVKPVYPTVRIYFFGSRPSGLGNIHSDLDIFLDIDNAYHSYDESKEIIINKLEAVKKLLKNGTQEWKILHVVKDARVPIIRVHNIACDIQCDLTFSNGLGSQNTLLMQHFFSLQPICHKICLFIKQWLAMTNLSTHFSTYTMVLMVVFYLQIKGQLPPVRMLQDNSTKPFLIGPWRADFYSKSLKELQIAKTPDDSTTCTFFLVSFFDFYSKFDFTNNIICPFLGTIVNKSIFKNQKFCEKHMTRYFSYIKVDPAKTGLQLDKPMCVQDPLEQNHNVAKAISEGLVRLLQQYFELTAKELRSRGDIKNN